MAAIASDVVGVVGGSLNILFTVVNGIQQTQTLRLEKKKLNLEIKKTLLETIQASNVDNVMKCYTTFEVLANKSGFIPIANNKIIDQLGVDEDAWRKIDQNRDGHIEMNEWIVFWYELEKATAFCQFCREPKFETCFICMRGFCAQHYEFEKTSQERLCSDCIKRHKNDPGELQQAVITKKKEIKEFEKEKLVLENQTRTWYTWSKSMPKKNKCAFDDCDYIAILQCYHCSQLCCSRCLSERAISGKYCCRNCFIEQKQKKCEKRKCSKMSTYTCGNKNCYFYACEECAVLYFPSIELNGIELELPVVICWNCEDRVKRKNKALKLRFPLEQMIEELLNCWSFTFCCCCFLSVEEKSYWICDDCDNSYLICEDCKTMEIDFEEHVSSKHKCSHYDKDGKVILKKFTKPQPTKPVDNWNGGNCSNCSKKLERATKTYFCKACDCKMCNSCYESNSFPKSSKHSVSHDVALNMGGKEMYVIKGSIEHKTEAVNNESSISKCESCSTSVKVLSSHWICGKCDSYMLCPKCFGSKYESDTHSSKHMMIQYTGIGTKIAVFDGNSVTKISQETNESSDSSRGMSFTPTSSPYGSQCGTSSPTSSSYASLGSQSAGSSLYGQYGSQCGTSSPTAPSYASFGSQSAGNLYGAQTTAPSTSSYSSLGSSAGNVYPPSTSAYNSGQYGNSSGTASPTAPSYASIGSQSGGSSSYGQYSAQTGGSPTPSSYASLGSSAGNIYNSNGSYSSGQYGSQSSGSSLYGTASPTAPSYASIGSQSGGSSSYGQYSAQTGGSPTPSSYASLGSSAGNIYNSNGSYSSGQYGSQSGNVYNSSKY